MARLSVRKEVSRDIVGTFRHLLDIGITRVYSVFKQLFFKKNEKMWNRKYNHDFGEYLEIAGRYDPF